MNQLPVVFAPLRIGRTFQQITIGALDDDIDPAFLIFVPVVPGPAGLVTRQIVGAPASVDRRPAVQPDKRAVGCLVRR
jgi:hypothetical protein